MSSLIGEKYAHIHTTSRTLKAIRVYKILRGYRSRRSYIEVLKMLIILDVAIAFLGNNCRVTFRDAH
jgi:hypothetical protein